MEDKNQTPFSEKSFEDMFLSMGNYMSSKLKTRIESIRKRIDDVKKSDKKNKDEIVKKLEELIGVMNSISNKTELQTKTQKELLDLMEKMESLDNEIDKLLLE